MEDGGEPPPLEDMAEQLERIALGRGRPSTSITTKITPSLNHSKKKHPASIGEASLDEGKSLLYNNGRQHGDSASFGGFQKGFLFGAKLSTKAGAEKVDKPEDDVIRPWVSGKDSRVSELEFPEVQQAMKEMNPTLDTESKQYSVSNPPSFPTSWLQTEA